MEVPKLLPDPYHDRVAKVVRRPPNRPLQDSQLFLPGDKIDTALLQDFLGAEGRLSSSQILRILRLGGQKLQLQPNLLVLQSPVRVVADLHGQYYDLLKILGYGTPLTTQYLFLGGYVSRGAFSLETLVLLLAYRATLPGFHLLRSNHETRQLS